MGTLVDPETCTLVGSGYEYSGEIRLRVLWSDPDTVYLVPKTGTLVEKGCGSFGRIPRGEL